MRNLSNSDDKSFHSHSVGACQAIKIGETAHPHLSTSRIKTLQLETHRYYRVLSLISQPKFLFKEPLNIDFWKQIFLKTK